MEQDAWADDAGVVVRAVHFDLVPDLPAALTDRPALRRGMTAMAADQGGTLIDADVVNIGGQPALRQVVKVALPDQAHGEAFLGPDPTGRRQGWSAPARPLPGRS
ncbi:hypothetical protein [Catellatospora tritici]|uniref:hypothetical protein n=1 Tax=Catellatospora tritici TaxID=2851566 RepID=UPI001C2CC814|nr:hypothetical protein [Catellatospora tritici]MBV1856460.1 hypothetical protein [Catellatospora tritici]